MLLTRTAQSLTDGRNPPGCLFIQSALACGDDAGPVRDELAKARCRILQSVRDRFERARQEGELPAGTDTCRLARFICTVMQGMSVQSCSGACRGDLSGVVEMALRVWPAPPPRTRR